MEISNALKQKIWNEGYKLGRTSGIALMVITICTCLGITLYLTNRKEKENERINKEEN